MIKLSEINDAFKNATPEERQELIELILPELIKNPVFKNHFDNSLLTSELKPIKRISTLETALGLNDFADEPTIPEQITELKSRIENIESHPQAETIITHDPKNIIPETKTEARALYLVQYLESEVKERNGELFLNGTEIKDLLFKIIPEKAPDCEIKTGQNIRKIKKDVLAKAAKLFPNQLFLNKNKNGRHETRVLFKPLHTVTT